MKPLKMVNGDGWLYPEGYIDERGHLKGKQFLTKMGEYEVAYKLHITLSDATYERDRDYVASFLYNNQFKFKCHYLRKMNPNEEPRAFTIYPEKESDLVDIVAGIIKLQQKHNLTAGMPSGDGIVVPGTSGLVTYHVERINEKLLRDMDSAGAFSDVTKGRLYFGDKLEEVGVKAWLKKDSGYIGTILPKSLRVDAMNFLFGKGPLDFLWSGDINTEIPPPPRDGLRKKKRSGLRKKEKNTKPGPPHSKNNHFNGSAPRRSSDPGEPLTGEIEILNPNVRPGTPDNPVCSNCLEYYHDKVSYDKFADDSSKTTLLFVIDDYNDQYDNRDSYYRNCVEAIKKITPHFTKYLTNGKVNLEIVGPIFKSKYSKYIPALNFGAEPSRPTGTGQGLRRKGGTALLKDKMEEEFGPHRIIQITAGRGYAMPQSYHILGSTRTPQSWAEIHCHELCHYLGGNLNPRSYGIYHTGWRAGDTHCPYNCLIHHYISCGNIAARHEGAIYDRFVR